MKNEKWKINSGTLGSNRGAKIRVSEFRLWSQNGLALSPIVLLNNCVNLGSHLNPLTLASLLANCDNV